VKKKTHSYTIDTQNIKCNSVFKVCWQEWQNWFLYYEDRTFC